MQRVAALLDVSTKFLRDKVKNGELPETMGVAEKQASEDHKHYSRWLANSRLEDIFKEKKKEIEKLRLAGFSIERISSTLDISYTLLRKYVKKYESEKKISLYYKRVIAEKENEIKLLFFDGRSKKEISSIVGIPLKHLNKFFNGE